MNTLDDVLLVRCYAVHGYGSVAIGLGYLADEDGTERPVSFVGEGRLMSRIVSELNDGARSVLCSVPSWSVLSSSPVERTVLA